MWSDKKSLALSKAVRSAVHAFPCRRDGNGTLAGTSWYFGFPRVGTESERYFLATVYAGSGPAAFLLWYLLQLLHRIGRSEVFVPANVRGLRRISWCCFAGAGICLLSVLYYPTWALVAVAAAFMGLIVRVVKTW